MQGSAVSSRNRSSWKMPCRSSDNPSLSRELSPHSFQSNSPKVFRGLCASWPALKWDSSRIERALPVIEVRSSYSGDFPRDNGHACPTFKLNANEFIRKLRQQSPHLYCHGNVLPEELAADCPDPQPLRDRGIARRSLWISCVSESHTFRARA